MGAEDFVKLHINASADFALTSTSDSAELAFYRGIQLCARIKSRGLVPRRMLSELGTVKSANELVRNGYWIVVPQGWAFVNWDKWNGDFDQVADKRERDAERKRIARRQAREEDIA
jgi:hypothetical protein